MGKKEYSSDGDIRSELRCISVERQAGKAEKADLNVGRRANSLLPI